ncbi:MAG: divergent polysaccharide deacetylase family protein [Candidatus Omnitrophica bacterium]|nr:divergent polysaccharide deacetylase family protein [Candidatus Omnitrophota bacterium]
MPGENKIKNVIIVLIIAIALFEGVFLAVLSRKKAHKKAFAPVKPQAAVLKGKIAIVIDDWGYTLSNEPILDQIKYPITGSILPNLKYSKEIAREFHKLGFEAILHLPMEPGEKIRLEQNTILTSMDAKTIAEIVNSDLDDLPYIDGASNHMGSKATQDEKTMSVVLDVLKKRNLFFLDSFVTSKSVCTGLAAKKHIAFARRDVFLDNKEESGYIKEQLNELKKKAEQYGKAIGIGHDRKVTLEILKESMPEIEKEGYKFVILSDLVN